jgi:copper chaperone CopZ
MKTMLLISGMRDNRCRERIAALLESLPGVREAEVSLYRAFATVAHEPLCSADDFVRAVMAAGYGAVLAPAGHEAREARESA